MRTPVVITDLTRMQHGRVCIAAYRRDARCVRPVVPYDGIMEDWLFDHERVIVRPFAVIELDLLDEHPDPPHTEDWLFDPTYKVWLQDLTSERKRKVLARIEDPSITSIFGTAITHEQGWFVAAGIGHRSLGTIRPRQIHALYYNTKPDGKRSYALAFTDQAGEQYRLSVTDLAFRCYLDHLHTHDRMRERRAAQMVLNTLNRTQVFLRIGLARGWDRHPDRCYLQITGVHTWPDYLEGRCFADFDTTGEHPKFPTLEDELPF